MKKNITLADVEKSSRDKKIDKKLKLKEGSPADKREDRKIQRELQERADKKRRK